VRRYGPLLALVLATLAGCAPAYLAELDSAATVTGQMTYLGTIGPLSLGSDLPSTARRFLPAKPVAGGVGLSVQSGFVLTNQGGGTEVSFVFLDPNNGTPQQATGGGPPFLLAGADPNYPLYDFDVTTTTTSANLVVFQMSPTTPSTSQATLVTATVPTPALPTSTLTLSAFQVLNTVFPADLVVGAQVSPNPGAVDSFNFLVSDATTTTAADGTSVLTTAPNVITPQGPPGVLPLTLPSGATRFFYGKSGTLSYASNFLNGAWQCIRWTTGTGSVTPLTRMTHRLDAVLTTGDLLSMEGGVLRLYDLSGNQLVARTVGSLQFCYEAYVGSVPYLFFSLALVNQHGDWTFSSYAIPTSSTRGLH
jgi:hypothetical protein